MSVSTTATSCLSLPLPHHVCLNHCHIMSVSTTDTSCLSLPLPLQVHLYHLCLCQCPALDIFIYRYNFQMVFNSTTTTLCMSLLSEYHIYLYHYTIWFHSLPPDHLILPPAITVTSFSAIRPLGNQRQQKIKITQAENKLVNVTFLYHCPIIFSTITPYLSLPTETDRQSLNLILKDTDFRLLTKQR